MLFASKRGGTAQYRQVTARRIARQPCLAAGGAPTSHLALLQQPLSSPQWDKP